MLSVILQLLVAFGCAFADTRSRDLPRLNREPKRRESPARHAEHLQNLPFYTSGFP